MKLIEEKVKSGGKQAPAGKAARPKSAKVIDLVAVLQQSLQQAQGGKKKTAWHHRKAA
jgi:non-homologous end joining protein Ku